MTLDKCLLLPERVRPVDGPSYPALCPGVRLALPGPPLCTLTLKQAALILSTFSS